MPSGAKRRKAAKKKKEQQQTNNSSSIISRNDDPKSQDERDSDGGEVGSPASQDHHNQEHPFNEENEDSEKRDHSEYKPVEGVTSDDAQVSLKIEAEDDSVVKTERELNSELNIESKNVSMEHVEFAKESHDGNDKSSSSSSSSDDESHTFDKKQKEEARNSALDAASYNNVEKVFPEEVTRDSGIEKPLKEANGNTVVETDPADDLAAHQVPMSEIGKHAMEGAENKNPEILDVIEPGLKEIDKLLPKFNDVISSLVPEKNEDKAFTMLDENVGVSTTVFTSNVNGNEDKVAGAHISKTNICAEKTKDSEVSGDTITGNEGKLLTSLGAHTSEASNDAVKARDYETSEYTEAQPLVPPAQQVTQRTSWMSCCGLLDVFTGSNR